MTTRNIAIAQPSTDDEDWFSLRESVLSGWLTQGPKVAEFERAFAEIHQVKHAIATTSCTTALHLTLAALEIGPGDEVIVPAFTWVATANVVLHCGAKPVFVDVDPKTYNLDPEKLKASLTLKTKALIPVHLFGLCADIPAIRKIAPQIPMIEDAACAVGASLDGQSAGSLGLAGAFSFHPRKVITTGEGGMITTNDDALAEKIKCLRNHGASISEEERHKGPKPYLLPEFQLAGFNYRMTDLQGALGLSQLKKLKNLQSERQKWAQFYTDNLSDIRWLKTPWIPKNTYHAWQAYVISIDPAEIKKSRNEILELLKTKGISARPGTHSVPHLQYYSKRFGYTKEDYPVSFGCEQNTITLPLHSQIIADDYSYIGDVLHSL